MALVFFGGSVALLAIVCGVMVVTLSRAPQASAAASQPFKFANVSLPDFPDRGPPAEVTPGILKHEISLGDSDGYYKAPGHGGRLMLYLPAGDHSPKSLPCILITGAGSNLLSGMSLGDADSPEHTPYVKAGYAVMAYEMDGPLEDMSDIQQMKRAYEAFAASRAGLVNARNALQFVLDKVPEVDPRQIYAAGHSSAATHALSLAEHEPRLAGVIAYAPAVNVPERFGLLLRILSLQLPGVVDFAAQSSPHTHVRRLKCATFLFHAEDDSNCPIAQTRKFAEELKQQGTDVTLVTADSGDHYDSMIEEGIPAALKWLSARMKNK
jgi:dienelactone hydrolase